jgi:phosphoenolpyruvate carboxykinase (GTP)
MPTYDDICWHGLAFDVEAFNDLMSVDREAWKSELLLHEEHFERLYDRLPKEFVLMRELILSSLWRSPAHWRLAHEREDEDEEEALEGATEGRVPAPSLRSG